MELVCWRVGVLIVAHVVVVGPLTARPYEAGTEHAGFLVEGVM